MKQKELYLLLIGYYTVDIYIILQLLILLFTIVADSIHLHCWFTDTS